MGKTLLELRHLRYFIAVAETGSVTLAAETRLHTSQPSLSRQIRDLEDEVGVELLRRGARGVELTDAGKAFMDHARLALSQVDAAIEAARRAVQPIKKRFALGFLTGQEMTWLPLAMHTLRDELQNVDVTVSSNYSPDLADALARGRLDLAFMRAEPGFDLDYKTVRQEPLVVLMPSDHSLAAQQTVRPEQLVGEPFVSMGSKASVLRTVIDSYPKREGVVLTPTQTVDNPAMVMSLVASTRGVTLIPGYVESLLPWSVVSRPLAGTPPTIDLVAGYSRSNNSHVLKLFLAGLDELIAQGTK
ncbi:LysR substrate-binding domain-containing protein [soil metagenome]